MINDTQKWINERVLTFMAEKVTKNVRWETSHVVIIHRGGGGVKSANVETNKHTQTHTHIYIYIYVPYLPHVSTDVCAI